MFPNISVQTQEFLDVKIQVYSVTRFCHYFQRFFYSTHTIIRYARTYRCNMQAESASVLEEHERI